MILKLIDCENGEIRCYAEWYDGESQRKARQITEYAYNELQKIEKMVKKYDELQNC